MSETNVCKCGWTSFIRVISPAKMATEQQAVVLLTVASPHPAIMVGDSDEVIATGPSVGVNQELGHVQVSAGGHHTSISQLWNL